MTVVTILIVVLIPLLVFARIYRLRIRRAKKAISQCEAELSRTLQRGQMQMWSYDVTTGTYQWMDELQGRFVRLMPKEFSAHYSANAIQHIIQAIQQLIRGTVKAKTLRLGRTMKDGSKRYFALDLSVLRRDSHGDAAIIIAFQNDITDYYLREDRDKELRMRYQSIFNNAMVDMVYYDSQGRVTEMNERACQTFGIDLETAKQQGISIEKTINEKDFDYRHFETFHATQIRPSTIAKQKVLSKRLQGKMCYELQVTPLYDTRHRMLCAYGSGLNVTEVADTYNKMREVIIEERRANTALSDYIRNTDYAMKTGGIRIVEYSRKERVFTIYSEINHVQKTLSAERALRLVDNQSAKTASHFIEQMDNGSARPFDCRLKTLLTLKDGNPVFLHLHFIPVFNGEQQTDKYFGMLRDISELKASERQLTKETIRARREELAKNTFMRNMSYEIRTPLNSVVGFAELFQQEHDPEDETVYTREIKDNATRLMELINNILFLSRLDAKMIDSVKQSVDLTAVIDGWCEAGWGEYRQEGVRYYVDHTFNRLVADIDTINLSIVIAHLCSNTARNTFKGFVRARYDYVDGQLVIQVENTGRGLAPEITKNIFERFGSGMQTNTGLSLPVCQGIMDLLGGNITMESTLGKGSRLTVTLPCEVSEIERKEETA